eukprot:GEZU01016300.1.p1 GENE.GEZU01016300.1~~GEZU01016300.1.p1  ORF type:complete len:136 (+),score=15.10 GEZU01016300.1:160-567(+)
MVQNIIGLDGNESRLEYLLRDVHHERCQFRISPRSDGVVANVWESDSLQQHQVRPSIELREAFERLRVALGKVVVDPPKELVLERAILKLFDDLLEQHVGMLGQEDLVQFGMLQERNLTRAINLIVKIENDSNSN